MTSACQFLFERTFFSKIILDLPFEISLLVAFDIGYYMIVSLENMNFDVLVSVRARPPGCFWYLNIWCKLVLICGLWGIRDKCWIHLIIWESVHMLAVHNVWYPVLNKTSWPPIYQISLSSVQRFEEMPKCLLVDGYKGWIEWCYSYRVYKRFAISWASLFPPPVDDRFL